MIGNLVPFGAHDLGLLGEDPICGVPSTITLVNSVLGECSGNLVQSLGYNIYTRSSCGLTANGELTKTNPLLGPLQDNGGFAPTMALLPGSPAIDAGHAAVCPATDARGLPRPANGKCDIGAYELQPRAR